MMRLEKIMMAAVWRFQTSKRLIASKQSEFWLMGGFRIADNLLSARSAARHIWQRWTLIP